MPSSVLEPEDRPNDGPLHPGLYVTATPIGNLADLSARAIRVLRSAEIIACEDTRVTGPLLRRLGATGRCLALHAHNEVERTPSLLAAVASGSRVALVCDAGTPAISDPGARLVAAAQAQGLRVVPIPGPSAVTTAVSVAALVDGRFRFEGFLPPRAGQRRSRLLELATSPVAIVLFEAPHRIAALARDLAAVVEPQRVVVVARELTKRFEQIVRLTAGELEAWLAAEADHRRGEFVVVLHPAGDWTAGDRAAGDRTAGDRADGDPVAGKQVAGDLAVGDPRAQALGPSDRTPGAGPAALGAGAARAADSGGPSELGRRAVMVLAESLPPRAAARAAARITGDDADALYRFRAGQRSRDAGP